MTRLMLWATLFGFACSSAAPRSEDLTGDAPTAEASGKDAGTGETRLTDPDSLSTSDLQIAPELPTVVEDTTVASDVEEDLVAPDVLGGFDSIELVEDDIALVPDDPGESGPYSIEDSVVEVKLSDGTSLVTTIYVPGEDEAFPVVVFLHGFQLGPDNYASYGQHLASWGYTVVMPQMPGGVFGIGAPNHVELKGYLAGVLDWIEVDANLTPGVLEGHFDSTRIALAGHSMGGKISLLLATEDNRPLGIYAIDPVDAAGGPLPVSEADYPSVTPELMNQVNVPLVLLGETLNGTCQGLFCQACAPADDNFQQYFTHATGPALEIEVVGSSHMAFLDDPNCGLPCSVCPAGNDDPAITHMLTRRYMTAFFSMVLQEQPESSFWLTGSGMEADIYGNLVITESKNGF